MSMRNTIHTRQAWNGENQVQPCCQCGKHLIKMRTLLWKWSTHKGNKLTHAVTVRRMRNCNAKVMDWVIRGSFWEFLTPSSWDAEFVPLLYTDPLNSHRRKLGAKSCTRRFTNCLRKKIPCKDGERNSMPGSGIFSSEVKGNQINWTQNNMSWRTAEDFPWVFLYFI